jgi:hypothetical protein
MKTTLKSLTKSLTIAILATVMTISFQSCAKKSIFLTSAVVPAAEGQVSINKSKNNNYVINIKISNLAEIDRLQPTKNSYVVWMEAEQGSVRNMGQIAISKNLNASFETTATLKPSKIFITAEEDENVQYPGSMVVLTTDNI